MYPINCMGPYYTDFLSLCVYFPVIHSLLMSGVIVCSVRFVWGSALALLPTLCVMGQLVAVFALWNNGTLPTNIEPLRQMYVFEDNGPVTVLCVCVCVCVCV